MNIRCINPLKNLQGQLGLALFFAGCLTGIVQAQVRFEAGLDQTASSGFLQPEHWLGEQLGRNDKTHWLTQRAAAGAQYEWQDWRLGISRGQQAYALVNTAALLLAAQDKAHQAVDLSTPGSFPLRAEVWKLHATTFSAAYKWRVNDEMALEIESFVQTIHDFEYMRSDLLLVTGGDSNQLTGQVRKIGTHAYGFLLNDQPDQGWGSGLNLRAHWDHSWGKLDLSVNNAWNRQQFNVVHQMGRLYNVSAQGNKVNIADLPAISGQYGLTQSQTRIPAYWQLSYKPTELPGMAFGATGLGQNAAWTAGYSGALAQGRWWIQTMQTRNWTTGYCYTGESGWSALLAISADERLKTPLLSSVMLSKKW